MKTKRIPKVVLFAVLALGCDNEAGGKTETGGVAPSTDAAYGDDEIGIRGAGPGEQGMGEAPGSHDTQSDQAGEGEGEGEQYMSRIDPSFLKGGSWSDPWYGMIYEGQVSPTLDNLSSYQIATALAGSLGGQEVSLDKGGIALVDDDDALVALALQAQAAVPVATPDEPEEGATIAYRDEFIFGSVFDKQQLSVVAATAEAALGFPTLVVRHRYDVVQGPQDELGQVLRSRCVVATHATPADDGAISGESACYAQDYTFDANAVVSLAQTLPLTVDPVEVAAQYEGSFGSRWPEFEGAADLCLCYAEDGVTPVECAMDERRRPSQRPAPRPAQVSENPYFASADMPATTFSIDVDTASYTLARQAMNHGELPEPESVRIEELINYFDFNYARPTGSDPFTVYTELGIAPWNPSHQLALVGLRGQEIEMADQPAANLVYLLDVSGSMMEEMPFIQAAFRMLTAQLRDSDTLSIVAYAGYESVVLDGGTGKDKEEILAAIDSLSSGGSTAGAAGIQTAYNIARKHFIQGGNNRVILATDGDFNVGVSSDDELVALIEEERESGVFLTVYGFSTWGSDNYQDEKMEQLANHGNGTYFFIDGEAEARRAFMHSLSGTLLTIAKDVKIQIQFNPAKVKGYRLIGYDNRVLDNDDFDDDTVDAGELGNSEAVIALLELIPADSAEAVPVAEQPVDTEGTDEFEPLPASDFMAVRLRFKNPDSETSELITHPVTNVQLRSQPTQKFVFASTIAQVGLALRQSVYLENKDVSGLPQRLRDTFEDDSMPAVAELLSFLEAASELLSPDH